MANYTLDAPISSIFEGRLSRPDVIWGSTVHPGAPLAAELLSHRYSVPFIYEIRDLWPETFVAMDRLSPTSLLAKSLYSLEKHQSKDAALVLSPLSGVGRYLNERYGMPKGKFLCIPNGISDDRVTREIPRNPSSAEGLTIFTFAGSMGHVNGLDVLVEAFRSHTKLTNNSALQLLGDGPKRQELISLVQRWGLSHRIRLPGRVSFDEVPHYLAQSDYSVAVIDDLNEVFKYGVSYIKIPEYMAAGRPVLLGANVSEDLIKLSGGGISVEPNIADMAQGFTMATSLNADTREEMGTKARDYVNDNLTYSILTEKLASRLNNLA